jgi:hypothetical protein
VKILNFALWIWTLLKIWIQMHFEPSKLEEVTSHAHYQFIHIGSYSENFQFPSLDLNSPQNLSLDAI